MVIVEGKPRHRADISYMIGFWSFRINNKKKERERRHAFILLFPFTYLIFIQCPDEFSLRKPQFIWDFHVVVCLIGWYSTRGLGKALAREFLLSGDRVVVASRRWYLDYDICLYIDLSTSMYHGYGVINTTTATSTNYWILSTQPWVCTSNCQRARGKPTGRYDQC